MTANPPVPLVGDLRDRIAAAITEDALKPRAERVGLVNAMLAVVQPLLAARDAEIQQLQEQVSRAGADAFAEAIDHLHTNHRIAPDPMRAPGLNFAIGTLMAMRDRGARATAQVPAPDLCAQCQHAEAEHDERNGYCTTCEADRAEDICRVYFTLAARTIPAQEA